ncbi:CD209 antigen-like protein 2 [Biomphalaria pfeifferi]|uniref:CD209 antigen-like protein 2 n=1 Tax=Biomphalaria pfeifferi TaxID=112525 RepID=A0AAD8BXG0_BIOPF|nr:CD209 antigen-like protein 2 [Biomphalaria pfeifferi]
MPLTCFYCCNKMRHWPYTLQEQIGHEEVLQWIHRLDTLQEQIGHEEVLQWIHRLDTLQEQIGHEEVLQWIHRLDTLQEQIGHEEVLQWIHRLDTLQEQIGHEEVLQWIHRLDTLQEQIGHEEVLQWIHRLDTLQEQIGHEEVLQWIHRLDTLQEQIGHEEVLQWIHRLDTLQEQIGHEEVLQWIHRLDTLQEQIGHEEVLQWIHRLDTLQEQIGHEEVLQWIHRLDTLQEQIGHKELSKLISASTQEVNRRYLSLANFKETHWHNILSFLIVRRDSTGPTLKTRHDTLFYMKLDTKQVKMATPLENPPLQEGIELVERKSVVPGEPEATNPNVAADTPNVAADTPNVAADTPNVAADTPNVAADTPNVAADTPNVAADTPNVAADTPNVDADTPNVDADTPNVDADTQQPAETNPEPPVDSPINYDADYPNASPFFGRVDQFVESEQRLISENDPELPSYSRFPTYPVGRSFLPLGLDDEDAPGPYSPPSEERSMYNLNPDNPNIALKKDVRTSTYCNLIGLSLVFIGLMASLFGWFNQLDGKQDTSIALADTVYRQMCGAIMAPNFNISYHEKCFCFYSKPMSWENARAFCRSQGRDNFLAEIETTEANIFLNAILQASNPGYGVWLGGLRQGKGSWTWNRTGLRFSKFQPQPSPWSQHIVKAPSTEADDNARECLEVTKKFDFNYAWKNTDCEARRMFLCSHTRYLPTCKCKGL